MRIRCSGAGAKLLVKEVKRRLLLAELFVLAMGLGPAATSQAVCSFNDGCMGRCATSSGCGAGCACIGGFCTSFR